MQLPDSLLPDSYLPHLDMLNKIVIQCGAPLEGNLFYRHNEPAPSRENISEKFTLKRRNFALACQSSARLLEIGFNAGHSALLALAYGVEYHGVDICVHPYTRPTASFLKKTFGERFHFYIGDSRKAVPRLAEMRPDLRFDMLHIDGHHGIDFCRTDTANCMAIAEKQAWLLLDDTILPAISEFYHELLAAGSITSDVPEGWEDNLRHKIGRIKK